jgi:DNA polymerase I-like protein with 3'-5' exonuclease and polymerase domains
MEVFKNVQKRYVTVLNTEQLKELYLEISQADIIAIDTETTGLNVRKDRIIGASFTTNVGNGYYLPILSFNSITNSFDVLSIEDNTNEYWLKNIFEILKTKKLIAHNAAFDTSIILNEYGIDLLPNIWIETLLAVHTIQEEGAFGFGNPFGLKSIAQMYQDELGLDVEAEANEEQIELKKSIQANGGSISKVNYEIYKADFEVLARYACADTDLTYRVALLFLHKIEKEGLESFFFDEEVMPVYREVTVPMERRGIMLDIPLIEATGEEVRNELDRLKQEIHDELISQHPVQDWIVQQAYIENYPPTNRGKYPVALSRQAGYNVDRINKKFVDALPDSPLKKFLKDPKTDHGIPEVDLLAASVKLWQEENEGYYLNIQSKAHLSQICFDFLGLKPVSETKTGRRKFDDTYVESISDKYSWAEKLRIYNKLIKINSTYVERFLAENSNGIFYPYFKQHGTVSGRYGSNLQQLPRPKEDGEGNPIVLKYNNLIRAFFKSRPGYVFIDADYESLEPHIFASISNDVNLQEIFNQGHDFYSTVAIRTEKLTNVSADKKAENFLKKIDPVKRNKAKSYSLGIAYGMSGYALAMTLKIPANEGEKLREAYLDGFPGVRKWLEESRKSFKENGFIKNKVGRVRHLWRGKQAYDLYGENLLQVRFRKQLAASIGADAVQDYYMSYRNALNNCLNFQIQSLAASVVNRAALQINNEFRKRGWDGQVVAQIHDQLVVEVREEYAKEAAKVVQTLMETTTQLPGVSLKAPPEIATNLRDGH